VGGSGGRLGRKEYHEQWLRRALAQTLFPESVPAWGCLDAEGHRVMRASRSRVGTAARFQLATLGHIENNGRTSDDVYQQVGGVLHMLSGS